MRCKCGFENAEDAKFCGSCGLALVDRPGNGVPSATAPSTPAPVRAGGGKAGARGLSRALVAVVAVVVAAALAGYWWLNRPPGRYKPDNSGLYPINVNGKYGFMDRSGKTVITPQFDLISFGFSEGLAAVQVGTKWGYINTKGVVAITPQFDFAARFQYGRAPVQLGDRWGFIDKEGKYISSPNFRMAVGQFSGDLAPVKTADGVYAFVRRSGEVVLSGKFGQTSKFSEGLAPAASGGKWGFIDTTGKWVIDPQFETAGNFADGLAPVIVGGRTGYIDKNGKFVVNPQYDSGDEFYDGYARFTSGGKSGFIDTKGRVVVDPKFLNAGYFSDGLARVRTDEGWGFIDPTGKIVVSPQFDSADEFQNGLAHVTVLGKEAYVTTTGSFVVNPFPGTTPREEKARIAAEAARSKAIIKVQQSGAMKVYFIQGHGEKNPADTEHGGYTAAKKALEDKGYKVETVNLASEATIPAEAKVLVLAGPTTEPSPQELQYLNGFLNDGGGLLVMVDPAPAISLEPFLKGWGVKVDNDIVLDVSGAGRLIGAGPSVPLVIKYENQKITEHFQAATFYPMSRSVKPAKETVSGVNVEILFKSNVNSWGETDLKNSDATFDEKTDLKGPLSLAVAVTKDVRPAMDAGPGAKARMVVVGDSDFPTNAYFQMQGNGNMFLNMVNWLAQKEDLISKK